MTSDSDYFPWPSTDPSVVLEHETVYVWPNGDAIQACDLEQAVLDMKIYDY